MENTSSIFNRLRSMQIEERSLGELIVEACNAGDALVDAAQTVVSLIADRPKLQNDDEAWAAFSQCVAALHRAFPKPNGNNHRRSA